MIVRRPYSSLRFSERTTTTFPGPRAEASGPPSGTNTGDTNTVRWSFESLNAAVPTSLMVQPIICSVKKNGNRPPQRAKRIAIGRENGYVS